MQLTGVVAHLYKNILSFVYAAAAAAQHTSNLLFSAGPTLAQKKEATTPPFYIYLVSFSHFHMRCRRRVTSTTHARISADITRMGRMAYAWQWYNEAI